MRYLATVFLLIFLQSLLDFQKTSTNRLSIKFKNDGQKTKHAQVPVSIHCNSFNYEKNG